MNAAILEYTRGMAIIKAFNHTTESFARFAQTVRSHRDFTARLTDETAFPYTLYSLLITANLFVLLPVGLWFHLTGSLDIPTLILFLFLGIGITIPCQRLMFFFGQFMQLAEGAKRVDRVLQHPALPEPLQSILPRRYDVTFDQVRFSYSAQEVTLQDISFTAPAQGVTALVGPRFQQLERALADFRTKSFQLEARPAPFILGYAVILELGFVFVMCVGTYLLLGGTLSVPMFLMFLVITLRFYHPLQQVGTYLAELRYFRQSFDRIQTVLDEPPLPEPADNPSLEHFDIAFHEVSFRYEDDLVLNRASFSIPERSVTALVGPSGSGKTTVANLIVRFWDVQAGEVRIGGRNIKELRTERLLSYTSMVFQDVYLFHDTVLNNIRLGRPDATQEEVEAAARAAQCHEFIRQLPDGYDTLVGEGGSTLSGGEKQRLSIARTIIKDTPIVLLDEATASLDPENEALIQQGFQALVRDKTLVVIAHRLATIQNADQILVMDHGQIVERGNHAELIAMNGLYARLWREQAEAHGWKIAASDDPSPHMVPSAHR